MTDDVRDATGRRNDDAGEPDVVDGRDGDGSVDPSGADDPTAWSRPESDPAAGPRPESRERWQDVESGVDRDVEPSVDRDVEQGVDGDLPVDDDRPVAAPGRAARVRERAVRRPRDWWNRPWTNERVVQVVVTSTSLVVTTAVVMMVLHFNPLSPSRDLILDPTMPTGGDMGAHVWAPAFLRDHFLPNFQISGWTMDWYGGLPLYRFYMVIPALLIVALDVVLPYSIAFKIVAMSGLLLFPLACWAFGRLAAFRHPIPELFAFGGLCFLLDESFEIYGGNVKSTMAGEYSFSIALTLAVFGLGLLTNGLRTGRYRVLAPVVLSLACVSHGIVLIFVAVAATVICLVWIDSRRLLYALAAGLTTVLLSAWWVGPFLFGHEFMTDMKYGFRPSGSNDSFWDMYFPLTEPLDILITTLAVIGFLTTLARRQRTGIAVGLVCIVAAVGVWFARDSLPVIGLLWNPRILPFFYLTRYLLMVLGAYEVLAWAFDVARAKTADRTMNAYEGAGAFLAVGVTILLVFGWMYEVLPGGGRVSATNDEGEATTVYAWGPMRKPTTGGRAVADGWSRYNWTGYEGRTAYPAYYDVVQTMDRIGDERGCGRAIWENNSDNSEYGTTMALMLLPHWTRGCIGSMEGLFFEATASTNYHFLTAAAVSESSSNPVRQLRYTNNDGDLAVRHMNDLGVRYMMVRTDAAKTEAAATDGLEYLATSGTWDVYQVNGSSVVEALAVEPVVVDQADGLPRYKPGDDRERNLELGTSWFQRPQDWPAMPVDDGPPEWQRVTAEIVEDERVEPFDDQRRKVDHVAPTEPIVPTPLPETTVSDLRIEQQSLRFEVDRVGVPVLVRVSYFPNWKVEGAEGPYRAGPNHMIVVPTDTEVSMSYDSRDTLDWIFYLMTAAGLALCVLWKVRGPMDFRDDDDDNHDDDGVPARFRRRRVPAGGSDVDAHRDHDVDPDDGAGVDPAHDADRDAAVDDARDARDARRAHVDRSVSGESVTTPSAVALDERGPAPAEHRAGVDETDPFGVDPFGVDPFDADPSGEVSGRPVAEGRRPAERPDDLDPPRDPGGSGPTV